MGNGSCSGISRGLPVPVLSPPVEQCFSPGVILGTSVKPVWTTLEHLYVSAVCLPSDIREHVPILRNAAFDKHVVEFGTRSGVSTAAFLSGYPKSLTCVDLDRSGQVDIIESVANQRGIPFQFIQANTLILKPITCDLLFIDTLHTANQLDQELERHAPHTREIILHDTKTFGERGEEPGSLGLLHSCRRYFGTDWELLLDLENNNGLRHYRRGA